MENAGAQTAALVLETEGQSLIAARGSAEQVEYFLPLFLPVEKAESLSLSVISWVKQTREHLVLDNAAREERFVEDDYVKRERPKSILCAPITHQSALSGIIYLENNLVEGAFTPLRLEVIKHLSSQIAISLENARLHEYLKKALDELKASETSDFRIIAATNKDLKEQVKKGLMREDFLYRIHIIPIHLPPLRERKEDIPLLIEHFMQNHPPQRTCPKSPSLSWKL